MQNAFVATYHISGYGPVKIETEALEGPDALMVARLALPPAPNYGPPGYPTVNLGFLEFSLDHPGWCRGITPYPESREFNYRASREEALADLLQAAGYAPNDRLA